MTQEKIDISNLVKEGPFERDQVIDIINAVVRKLDVVAGEPDNQDLVHDLLELKNIIEKTRQELNLGGDIKNKDIPTATDELDAVVGATEDATGTIMDACEEIQKAISNVDDPAAQKVEEQVLKIFEACSFQDITGQRITKVVKTLKDIEEKVSTLLSGVDLGEGSDDSDEDSRSGDEKLLNGPQMPGEGVSQSDVDKLFD